MATINLSTGSAFGTGFNPATARQLVESGNATVITPGTTGFDVVQSINPTVDAEISAGSPSAPFLLGVDSIFFTPLQIPEPAAGL